MAGTLIHLASRFKNIGPTLLIASGQGPCRDLPRTLFGIGQCIWNADSYRYFAEDPDSYNDMAHHNDP